MKRLLILVLLAALGCPVVVATGTSFAQPSPHTGLTAVANQPVAFGGVPGFVTSTVDYNAPVVGMAADPDGNGCWLVASDGGVFAFGGARFDGSLGATHLNAPVVGIAADPDGSGYWLVASDGGVFAFGSARFDGSMGSAHLNAPVVGIAADPDGSGYWLVASDGGVFAFGGARFDGSMGSAHLNAPVVGIAADPDGSGYWLTAVDGGVFAFGGARFDGSMGSAHLNAPVVGIAADPDGSGYWLTAVDGGVFAFGGAPFYGSLGFDGSIEHPIVTYPITAIAPDPARVGYWLLTSTAVPATMPLPAVQSCGDGPADIGAQVRPASIFLGCATSAAVLTPISWNVWTEAGATGTATLHWNDCQPNCADGTYSTYPVTVQLSAPGFLDGAFAFMTITTGPTGIGGPGPMELSGLAWGWA